LCRHWYYTKAHHSYSILDINSSRADQDNVIHAMQFEGHGYIRNNQNQTYKMASSETGNEYHFKNKAEISIIEFNCLIKTYVIFL